MLDQRNAISLSAMLYRMHAIPANLDLTTTRLSNQGLYRVRVVYNHLISP
jgi:hypothetical protein